MLTALIVTLLAQNPATMAGGPVGAVSGSVIDFTQSLLLTGPLTAAQCTGTVSGLSVSRTASSYCQRDDGVLALVGANSPVVEANGLRVEPASTNRVAFSEALNGNWTATTITKFQDISGPGSGTVPAEEFDDTGAGGNLKSPTFTITGTSAVLSTWYSHAGATDGLIKLRDITASADRCTITLTHGTSNFSNTMETRSSCAASGTIVSGNNHQVWFYPGGVAGTSSGVSVTGVQVEPARTTMTSYIPTSGVAVTRDADVPTMAITNNSATGCLKATVYARTVTASDHIASTANGTIAAHASSTRHFTNDGTNTVNGPVVSSLVGRSATVVTRWGATLTIDTDTAGVASGAFDGSLGGTTLYLGSNVGVTQWLEGWIKAVKVSTDKRGCQ